MKSLGLLVSIAAFQMYSASQSALADWAGHVATLREAQSACQDIDSTSCIPFLAEAVAVADTLQAQAVITTGNGQNGVHLFGVSGSVWKCDSAVYENLNGQSLLPVALAEDSHSKWYWTQALLAAALGPCKRE